MEMRENEKKETRDSKMVRDNEPRILKRKHFPRSAFRFQTWM